MYINGSYNPSFARIETTGLPNNQGLKFGENPSYQDNNKYDNCRIVQISYMLCNSKLEQIELNDFIIKVNFDIQNSNYHNITNEISITQGIDFNLFCNELYQTLKKCSHIISHNINFDINVIKNELYRIMRNYIINEINNKKLICSMKETAFRNIININQKYPSLKELYTFATYKEITNQHNSKFDVINLHEALQQLQYNNIFIINDISIVD